MHINTRGLSRHSTKTGKQSPSITLKPSLIMLTTIQPKIILRLAVFTRNFFQELHNKCTIVHEGTGYPSNHNPMGVPISE